MQLVDSSTENRESGAGGIGMGTAVNEARAGAPLQAVGTAGTAAQSAPAEASPGGHEGGYPVWRVACGDMINRERSIAVYVDGGEVVVVGPPGESARLSGAQINELKTALNEAAKQAER